MTGKKKLSPLFLAHFLPHRYSEGAKIKGEKILAEFQGKKILDAGSGCGWISRMALDKKYSVTSIDCSQKVINLEKEFARLTGLKPLKIIKASIVKLPFNDETFDTVVCSEVLEHIEPKYVKNALKEFNRVLRGGVLVVTVPGFFYWLVYDFILAKTFQKNKKSKLSYLGFLNSQMPIDINIKLKFEEEDSHKQQFSKDKIKKLFEEAGFELIKSKNLEVLTPIFRSVSNLFVSTRKKFKRLEEFDSYLSKYSPLFIGSDWLFVGRKKRK